jgi:hypothetical protein
LGDDFFFSALVFAFAFLIPVLSNQLDVAVRRRFIAGALMGSSIFAMEIYDDRLKHRLRTSKQKAKCNRWRTNRPG